MKDEAKEFLKSRNLDQVFQGVLFDGIADLLVEFYQYQSDKAHGFIKSKNELKVHDQLVVCGNSTGHEVNDGEVVSVYKIHGYHDDLEIEPDGIMCQHGRDIWFMLLSELRKIN